MKLNKNVQYALLFTMYLARAGRSTTAGAAESLGLSVPFLEQIARKLRVAGLVRSIRGPGGGYELVGNPTVNMIFASLYSGAISAITEKDFKKYMLSVEGRSLLGIASRLTEGVNIGIRGTVKDCLDVTIQAEVEALNMSGYAGSLN